MAQITAAMVADLRKKTGVGMMECKKALTEANGDFDAAAKILREKGLAVAAKKADRIAADGIVSILSDGGKTAMIEVNTETDFVAKNATFIEFVQGLLRTVLKTAPASVDDLLAKAFDGTDVTVDAALKDKIFTIGEKISIRRFTVVEGIVSTYVHGNGAIGVVVKFDTSADIASKSEFKTFAKDIALQVAAYPTPYLYKEDVPESVLNEEKEVIQAQIKNDPKNASKPQNVIDKMVIGKLGKFYENNCVYEQEYFKEDDMKVSDYVKKAQKEIGDLKVVCFVRYEKGEGIQKREDDLASEVAKMISK